MTGASEKRLDPAAAIAALRVRGAHRVDPIRLRQAEAMARRALAHQGEARRLLDEKVAHLVAGLERALEARAPAMAAGAPPSSPLARLLADLARDDPKLASDGAEAERPAPAQRQADLKAVREHRSTWARLGVDQRLRQSLATVPDKAGPLNTQRLMHQALTAMRDASPAYLQRFITQVEALLWLDQASLPLGTAPKKDAARNHRQR
jgi:hypothetical protein